MEPRPPRPRTPQPGYPGAGGPVGGRLPAASSGYGPGAPEASYGVPPGAAGYGPIPGAPMGGEAPLLNRQERKRQRVARGVLAFVGALLVLFAIGWVLRDRLLPQTAGPAGPAPVAQEAAAPTPVQPAVGSLASPAPTAPAVANLLATATPTPPPAGPPTTAPQPIPAAAEPAAPGAADQTGQDVAQDATVPLADLLPTVDQLPAGFTVSNEGDRSEAIVLGALGDSEEAAALLDDWGWQGNSFRDFLLGEEEAPAPGTTIFYSASVHRFADPESAEKALTYFSDIVAAQGLEDVEVEPVGETVRALTGAPDGVAFTVLYVRDGSLMFRIAGSSNVAEADPTADVTAFAQMIVQG